MRLRFTYFAAAWTAAISSLLAGCSGVDSTGSGATGSSGSCTPTSAGSSSDAGPPATFATLKLVLQGGGPIMTCVSASCHAAGGMNPPGNPLTLAIDDNLYKNLTTHISQNCGNIPVVNPGHPEQSALIKVLKEGCGATPRMPYQCSGDGCIPDDYIAAVAQWIADCAPQ